MTKLMNLNKDSKKRSRIEVSEDSIKARFFIEHNLSQVDAAGVIFDVYRKDSSEVEKTYQPTHDGKLLLAKYYEDKYGIKILNIANVEDGRNLLEYISANQDNFKIGVLLPSALEGQRIDLETYNKKTSQLSHCCPIIIERESGVLRLIDLDAIEKKSAQNRNLNALLQKISPQEFYCNRSSSLMDTNSCHTYAISILKDALRIDNLAQNLRSAKGETNLQSGLMKVVDYEVLPESLLKLVQSEGYLRKVTADMAGEVIRSNKTKPPKPISQQREENSETVKIQTTSTDSSDAKEDKIRNSFLWTKANQNPRRIVSVLEKYSISDDKIDEFIIDLKESQTAFLKLAKTSAVTQPSCVGALKDNSRERVL